MKKSVVVFDFDGVLTKGGEGLKQKAWDIMCSLWKADWQNRLADSRKYWSGGKGSRTDILSEVFVELQKRDVADVLVTAYADCYNTIVQKLLEQSGMPEGTEETLKTLSRFCTLFVNSATPEKAVRESVQNFGIAYYFRSIFGQPYSKVENLERTRKIAKVDKECMLFVGDSEGDWKAARECGCDFVGVKNEWNKWEKGKVAFALVSSIAELPALLEV